RLLQHIIKCDPHPIMETVSLNNARQTVLLLCEPLAEINRNIQENMVEVEKFKKEMKISDIADEKFKKKLTIPYIKLEVVNLERPRVVCTKNSCRTSVIQDNCHVKWKWLNTFIQKRSGAMKFGMCSSCGCHAKNHKAIFYNSVSTRIEKEVENIKERIDELKKYQNTVEDTVVKFTQFLKQNAITAFNDAYVEYLGYIIHLEKEKVSDASERNNNEILEGLEVTKRKYEEKVKTIKTIGKNESSSDSLSFEDIFKLEQKLYELPDIGEYLQAIKKEEEEAF
ncbi:19423_t:CDS:1, partial [Gigaspora rosea]